MEKGEGVNKDVKEKRRLKLGHSQTAIELALKNLQQEPWDPMKLKPEEPRGRCFCLDK